MKIEILKCHGSGNDFILIDEYNNNYDFSEEQRIKLTLDLCRRDSALGADGILFFTKSQKAPAEAGIPAEAGSPAEAGMRIFNADGSEAEMCGNGLRCLGRYALEVLKKEQVLIETIKENLLVKRLPDIFEGVVTVKATIKPANFHLTSLPMLREKDTLKNEIIPELSDTLRFTALSIPNPHIVAIVDNIDEKAIDEIGKKANEAKNIFPKGINLNFVKILGDKTIYVQTYERGVGLTNACGTGMSSSSLVTCVLGFNNVGEEILVVNRGGMVKCQPKLSKEGKYYVELMGNATYTFRGEVEFDFENNKPFSFTETEVFQEDIRNYEKLAEYAKKFIK